MVLIFALQVRYSGTLGESFESSCMQISLSSSGPLASTSRFSFLMYLRQREQWWQILSLLGEPVRYSH